ncbi:MAG: VCBS repeat-containing protein [Planctomycetes bacterium]|nr:VCBS repeat-containing protein [Planctomycetota bacterium]
MHDAARAEHQLDAFDQQARSRGFSLRATTAVESGRREALERLCRYVRRPAIDENRLAWTRDGKVVYRFKRPWQEGTKRIVFEPLVSIERLAALVRRPRRHPVTYHGAFAPGASYRDRVVPPPPAKDQSRPALRSTHRGRSARREERDDEERTSRRHSWARLVSRCLGVDVLVCPRCQTRRRLLTFITDPGTARWGGPLAGPKRIDALRRGRIGGRLTPGVCPGCAATPHGRQDLLGLTPPQSPRRGPSSSRTRFGYPVAVPETPLDFLRADSGDRVLHGQVTVEHAALDRVRELRCVRDPEGNAVAPRRRRIETECRAAADRDGVGRRGRTPVPCGHGGHAGQQGGEDDNGPRAHTERIGRRCRRVRGGTAAMRDIRPSGAWAGPEGCGIAAVPAAHRIGTSVRAARTTLSVGDGSYPRPVRSVRGSVRAMTTRLLLVSLLAVGISPLVAQARFSSRASEVLPDEVFHVGSMAVGDVDGDGIDDLLLGISYSVADERYGVRLYRGTAGLGFVDRTAVDVPRVAPPRAAVVNDVAFGDVDGDGDLDALLLRVTTAPTLLINDGAGGFSTAALSPLWLLSPPPNHGAFADFDGDGDLDLAVCILERIDVLENDGSGTFTQRNSLSNPMRATDFATADLDADGNVDLVQTGCSDSGVWWGDGAFGFVRQHLATGCAASQILLADLDADGDHDLVFAMANALGGTTGRPEIRWNAGRRQFLSALNLPLGPHSGSAVAALDFDADGDLDLVLGGRAFDDRLQLWRHDSGGRFVDVGVPLEPFATPGTVAALTVLDAEGDGDVDLYVASTSNRVGFRDRLLVWQEGRFYDTSAVQLESLEFGRHAALFDFDGDGDLDVVRPTPGGLAVRANVPGSVFGAPILLPVPGVAGEAISMTHGDVDGDGDVDVWLAMADTTMRLLIHDGQGGYRDETAARVPSAQASASVRCGVLEDFDLDGDLDLAIGTGWGAPFLLLRNDGSGVFGYLQGDWLGSGFAHDLGRGDLDADGDADLLVAAELPTDPTVRLYRYRNDGPGRLRLLGSPPLPALRVASEALRFALGDVDGDGDADLVTSQRRLWINDGAGGFTDVPGALGPPADLLGTLLADVDGDGDLDAVLAVEAEGSQLLINDGTGRFSVVADAFATRPWGAAGHLAADVDADGDTDLLPTSENHEGIELQLNLATDLHAPRPASLGATFELRVRHPRGRVAVVAYGLSLLRTPLVLPFGTLRIDAGVLLVAEPVALSAGAGTSRLPLPVVAGITGLPLHGQALVEDSSGALRLTGLVTRPLVR